MATIVEDYSPIYQGDTLIPFAVAFQTTDPATGKPVAFPLSGGDSISMTMHLRADPSITKVCSGPWTMDDAANGWAHYDWQDGDVDTPGDWLLFIMVRRGGKPVHADSKLLEILPAA